MTAVVSVKKEIRAALTQAGMMKAEKEVLSKCAALASTLNLSPEEMATCWEAFSLNKQVNELTKHTFEAYKMEVYKHSEKLPVPVTSSSSADVLRGTGSHKRPAPSMVTPPAPKRAAGSAIPDTPPTSSVDSIANNSSRQVTNSPPAARRTTSTPLPKYDDRANVGQTVAKFNPHNWSSIKRRTNPSRTKCLIDSTSDLGGGSNPNITKAYRHMFTAVPDRAEALEEHLRSMGQKIIERYEISADNNSETRESGHIAPLEQVNVPRQEAVCVVGRICNEAHSGKLNSTSVVLEGTSSNCGGARINVDLSFLKSKKIPYSLFPGQIVAIEGMNPTGRKLVAHRICEGAAHPSNTSSVGELRKFHCDQQDGSALQIVTACGPFTTSDNMDYQPIVDLMHVILELAPDVVILNGPFVDTRQEMVQKGETTVEVSDGQEMKVSFETLFASKISALIEEALSEGEDDEEALHTQFVLVPSLDDATAKWVYPQPPLMDRSQQGRHLDIDGALDIGAGSMGLTQINHGSENSTPRVHCFSNPCTFKINEVVFGVTSTDVLFHMSMEETNSNLEPGSRLRRIAQHALQQQSYYPLFPPPQSIPTNLDLKRMGNWQIPCAPDVFILPSRLTSFATPVLESTIVVNPGHLARGTTGGTYGVMEIRPIKRETLDDSGGDGVCLQHNVQDRMHVEIKRI